MIIDHGTHLLSRHTRQLNFQTLHCTHNFSCNNPTMSSSTMSTNNYVAASTAQKYLLQHPPQHASSPKLIKLSPSQLFVLSELRRQITMKAVEHDPLVAASAARSREKILFIASTESTERYTARSSITTRSQTKIKKGCH